MTPFLNAYFARLGWTGTPDVSIETLRSLHIHHNSAIPFENLDVLLPREMHLDDRALEDKLVHSERLASIGRLAAGVAHEIGNPITGIACLAQNLREEREGDSELTEISAQIIEQTKRVSRIVQSLMSFAHAGGSHQNNEEPQ